MAVVLAVESPRSTLVRPFLSLDYTLWLCISPKYNWLLYHMVHRRVRVRVRRVGEKMEGRKDNKPLTFPAGVCCSALQVCSERAAASRSYIDLPWNRNTTLVYHHLQSHTSLIPRLHGRSKILSSLGSLGTTVDKLHTVMHTDRHYQRSLRVPWVFPTSLTW